MTPGPLLLLTPRQKSALLAWAKDDAASKSWKTLAVQAGGAGEIEMVQELLVLLEREGWLKRRTKFVRGSHEVQGIDWVDLAALKSALGLDSRDGRRQLRAASLSRLADWASGQPDLAPAAEALQANVALTAAQIDERFAVLQALAAWRDEQRSGTRRDFELTARGATKSLTQAEWKWLQGALDLSALGVEGFTPMVSLAGELVLLWGEQVCDLRPLHFAGFTSENLRAASVAAPPMRYWLIENRASFERQAALKPEGTAIVWLPGRPPLAWQAAMASLLEGAPAPAWISADPDPAGIEIALTAGALWSAQGLSWEPWKMGTSELRAAPKKLPLSAGYDRQVLDRVDGLADLHPSLRELSVMLRSSGLKAEQEGWL